MEVVMNKAVRVEGFITSSKARAEAFSSSSSNPHITTVIAAFGSEQQQPEEVPM
jgi:hypothetical protein